MPTTNAAKCGTTGCFSPDDTLGHSTGFKNGRHVASYLRFGS
ncbi:hypothetical protein [Photorhabdus laumondii]